jgi:hypothetical protein
MALLKLWNSLLGRTSDKSQTPGSLEAGRASSDTSSVDSARSIPAADPAQPLSSGHAATSQAKVAHSHVTAKPRPSAKRGLFGGGSPHAAILKKLRGVSAESVLEISVGDGSRAVEVLALLRSSAGKSADAGADSIKLRYAAIDQFEMGGGTNTLMQFHQTIRGGGIRPQVFPEPVDRGLMRVAHTLGSIDLILISADAGDWDTPETKSLLARVVHDQSQIFFERNDAWHALELSELGSEPVHRRAA